MATEEHGDCAGISSDIQAGDRGSFRCLLCCISVPNRPSLNDHLRGKRHTRMCEERAKRQQQQECSVFVSGFPKSTTEDQLRNVFQPISSVKTVVMDKDKGLYAIVQFDNPEGVNIVLARNNIKLDEHRLKVKPRKKTEFKKKKIGTQSLQPPDPEALCKELLCCTNVENQMKSVVKLCSPSHYESHLRELLLSLLREAFTEFFPACKLYPFGSSINGFEISGCDLDLYLELGETKETTEESNEQRTNIADEDLKEEIKDKDTNNGSEKAATGKETACLVEEVVMESDEESENDGDENITPGLSLLGLSNEEILNLVERVLRQCIPGVHGVQTVSSARRPVVRFQHKTSGLRGDITLNNKLALSNSRYLHFCSDLDPRVPQLVYTVRYWARMKQLAGNPLGGGPLLNNYALTLLLIFFLQSRNPPVIPSLSQLRELCAAEPTRVIDGWDCTFPSDPTCIPASENKESVGCLLSAFFSFFSKLDLHSSILCPRDGAIIMLPFTSPLPSWIEGFRLGPFNVQDPFELSHNVCSNVSSKTAGRFSTQCIDASSTCRSPFYNLRSSSRPWGITLLLLPNMCEHSKKKEVEISIPLAGVSLEDVSLAVKRCFIDLLLCTCDETSGWTTRTERNQGSINGSNDGKMEISKNESEQAVPHMERLVIAGDIPEMKERDLLEKGIQKESTGRKRESDAEIQISIKKRKMDNTNTADNVNETAIIGQNVHKERKATNLKELVKNNIPFMRILVWHKVWEGRRKHRRRILGEGTCRTEVETSISRALASGTVEGKAGEPLMQITVTTKLTPEGNVQLNLIPDVDDYQYSTNFFHFLKGFLPGMVQEILS